MLPSILCQSHHDLAGRHVLQGHLSDPEGFPNIVKYDPRSHQSSAKSLQLPTLDVIVISDALHVEDW
jgi:hypothetical protein